MKPTIAPIMTGNRCGHDPQNPILSPPEPIRTGPGGLPRILSLAAERAKEFFFNPKKCPELQSNPDRQTRSERREAIQVVLEYLLSRMDLATLCVGLPTPRYGFVDIDMKSIVAGTGLGQRRCERAIAQLKTAGFMKVDQPRHRNEDGKYVGLRAVRLITRKLFEWLNLGPMLDRERKRASQALGRRAAQLGRALGDLVGRRKRSFRMDQAAASMAEEKRSLDPAVRRDWNSMLVNYLKAGMEVKEAQIKTNRHFGFPLDWSPGQGAPAKA